MKKKYLLSILLFLAWSISCTLLRAQCQAGFTTTINGGTVSLTNISSTSGQVNYYWVFGDGNYDWSANPGSHTFQYNGTYVMCLTISDSLPQTCNSTFCDTLVITNAQNPPCDAFFTANKDSLQPLVHFYSQSNYNVQWAWDFGDGNTSTLQYPVHQYSVNGVYNVCLTAITTVGDTCTFCDSINSTPCSQLLNASFTTSFSAGTMTASSTCSGAMNPVYHWNFGDGNYGNGSSVTHTYQYNGAYNVCLTYIDSSGICSAIFCDTVNITGASPYPCNAMFAYQNDSMGNAMIFWDQSTAGITAWNWSFPGGTPSSSTQPYPGPINYSPGTYTASLTVTNQSGISCSYSNAVNVGSNCTNVHANFSMNPTATPHVWNVTNYSTGTGPITYIWNWGDGSPNGTGPNPSHTYANPGWYTICLTLVDANGCGASYCYRDTLYKWSSNSSMVTVHVTTPSGVYESELASSVHLYPNPTSGSFILESDKQPISVITIYDLLGNQIESMVVHAGSIRSNLNLPAGLYWMHIALDQKIVRKKLIITE